MAVLHKSVLGTFSNKVGGVVGSSWKGIPVVRSLPQSVANPRSAPQMTQRMRFALMVGWAQLLLQGWIRPLWNRESRRMSGFNRFIRTNMQAFNDDGNIVLTNIIFSTGRLLAPVHISYGTPDTSWSIYVSHPTNDRYASANDEIYLFIWNKTLQKVIFSGGTGVVRGNTNSSIFQIAMTSASLEGSSFFIAAAYRHPRGLFLSRAATNQTPGTPSLVTPTSAFLFEFAKIMKIDTSNIDTSLSEAEAVAVLKEAIKEKAAVKDVTIRSEGTINIEEGNKKPEYIPERESIEVEKVTVEDVYEEGKIEDEARMQGRSLSKSNRR